MDNIKFTIAGDKSGILPVFQFSGTTQVNSSSHSVRLLDGLDVEPLELHNRLHVALQRVKLP